MSKKRRRSWFTNGRS